MKKVEYRVRPVTRHVITRYTEEGRSASLETLGEVDSEAYAEQICAALRSEPPEFRQWILVERSFELRTETHYFETEQEALKAQDDLLAEGREFRLFSRPVTDPITLARLRLGQRVCAQPTSWPHESAGLPG